MHSTGGGNKGMQGHQWHSTKINEEARKGWREKVRQQEGHSQIWNHLSPTKHHSIGTRSPALTGCDCWRAEWQWWVVPAVVGQDM